jgi:hypothetical protein
MKRNYFEEIQLFASKVVLFWSGALLLFLLAIPFFSPNYFVCFLNIIVVPVILLAGFITAEVIGINLTIYKTFAFAISAFCASIAGGLYGFFRYINL